MQLGHLLREVRKLSLSSYNRNAALFGEMLNGTAKIRILSEMKIKLYCIGRKVVTGRHTIGCFVDQKDSHGVSTKTMPNSPNGC